LSPSALTDRIQGLSKPQALKATAPFLMTLRRVPLSGGCEIQIDQETKESKIMAKKKKKVTEDVTSIANTVWLAGLGALATTQEEGGKLFKKLVKKGEKLESKSKDEFSHQVDRAKGQVQGTVEKAKGTVGGALDDVANTLADQLSAALHRFGVPTRDEIKTLTNRVEALMAKVDELQSKPAAKKPAAKRTRTARPKASTTKATASKTSAAKKPVAKKAVAKKPVAKKPVAKTPAASKPAVTKPAATATSGS